jgi:hypothetical protein
VIDESRRGATESRSQQIATNRNLYARWMDLLLVQKAGHIRTSYEIAAIGS